MPPLTPLALENATLLRRLQAQDFDGKTALAKDLGRDLPNLNKTLKRLEAEGLALALAAQLTEEGANAVRVLDQLEAGEGPPAAAANLPDGYVALAHHLIAPDPLNPRKYFDPQAVAELAASIHRDGLLENLVVRPTLDGVAVHRLVAGERRWRAMGLLIEDGRWPADTAIVCKVVAMDDATHRRIALIENLQRKDLRPIDEAAALKELIDVTGKTTAEVAEEIGFTQRFVQQRLQLLDLPVELQSRLNAGDLSIEKGREAAAVWPKLPPIKQVELREGKITVEACKAWVANLAPPVHLEDYLLITMAEVAWAIFAKPGGYWSDTTCDYKIDGASLTLQTQYKFLSFSKSDWAHEKGATKVRLTQEGFKQLARLCGADDKLSRTALEPLVRRLRVSQMRGNPLSGDYKPDAHKDVDALFKAKRYYTEWLNPPFEVDPAEKVKREQERVAQKEREARWSAEAKEREEAQERQRQETAAKKAADVEAGERALAAIRLFEDRVGEGADIRQKGEALMLSLDYRPPFTVVWDGQQSVLQDADGKTWTGGPQLIEGLRRVMAIAINTMLGLPPTSGPPLVGAPWSVGLPPTSGPPLVGAPWSQAPEDREQGEPEVTGAGVTREAYEGQIADLLLERDDIEERVQAIDVAQKALTAFLAKHEIEFGDPDEDWELILDDVYGDAIELLEPA